MNIAEPRRVRANLLLLLAAAIWGFAFVAQVAGAHVGAFTFNSSRFLLGALSLVPVIAWLDRRAGLGRAERRRRWRAVVGPGSAIGVVLFAGSSLQQIALEYTTAGKAAFVTGLYVVLVPLVGVLLGHRIRANIWGGAAFAVVGLYLLTMTGGLLGMNPGDLLCLAGTVFWTVHIVVVGRFAKRVDPLRLSVAQFASNSVYAAVAALLFEPHPFQGLPTVVGPLAYAGLMSVGVAYTLQVVGQRDALASHAALIMSLETVFGAIGGALFLGERMAPVGYLGAALMLVGIIWSQLPARHDNTAPQGGPVPTSEPLPEADRAAPAVGAVAFRQVFRQPEAEALSSGLEAEDPSEGTGGEGPRAVLDESLS